MSANLDNLDYRKTWNDLNIDYYEGYRSKMNDFHMHDYYEISFIISGDVKVLLSDSVQEGSESKIVLTKPSTPHFIISKGNTVYRRLNVLFSEDFTDITLPENKKLFSVFGKNGKIIIISEKEQQTFVEIVDKIKNEANLFRRKLLLLYLISLISDICENEENDEVSVPSYIIGAITYISTHYNEKIIAEELARKLGVCRTTLMVGFKEYTSSTFGSYILKCRLKQAVKLLKMGKTEQEIAIDCGFGDTCNLIRSFKRTFGKTPKQYIKE